MKFVILGNGEIPGYNGVRGPILTPSAFDLHLVLKWLSYGLDIREVMPDGSYRKLQFNDERLMKEIDEELEMKRIEKEQKVNFIEEKPVKVQPKAKVAKVKEKIKVDKEVKQEEVKKEEKPSFIVDDLQKPE